MGARVVLQATASSSSRLNLSWALGRLQKEWDAPPARPAAADDMPTSSGSMGCMTPSCTDSGAHGAVEQQQVAAEAAAHATVPRSLSVHWAEALEEHLQQPHAPQHAQLGPDKPCLKPRASSFPYVEEAARLEGLMRRPRALIAGGPQLDGGPAGTPVVPKKRSRLAAFGQ